uniref:Uncharacterized protein n=1 Tax=Magnetococcus massalia (strain MO-1) TaxID=451514 RepID=A0A1S7LPN0_MAGMO|nr:Conserved protein of unknown function [Candidatus Magnetococcus massalia]
MRYASTLGGLIASVWLISAWMILGWDGLQKDLAWVGSIFLLLFASGMLMRTLVGFMGGCWDMDGTANPFQQKLNRLRIQQ